VAAPPECLAAHHGRRCPGGLFQQLVHGGREVRLPGVGGIPAKGVVAPDDVRRVGRWLAETAQSLLPAVSSRPVGTRRGLPTWPRRCGLDFP
jgi:hypothetical protein